MKFKFQDLVDFGGVAILVESVIYEAHTNALCVVTYMPKP